MNYTKYDFGAIVAVDQIDDAVSSSKDAGTVSVGINALAEGTTDIVIMSGNSGNTDAIIADKAATLGNGIIVASVEAPVTNYTVTFVVDPEAAEPYATAETVESKVTAPADPVKENFTFVGWATTETGVDAEDPSVSTIVDLATEVFEADTTLYAIFEEVVVEYTVSFEIAAELDLVAPEAIVTSTGKATLPAAPEKAGYTFDGWYLATAPETLLPADTEVDVTGDVTYIAKYTEEAGGGEGGEDAITVTFVNGADSTVVTAADGTVVLPTDVTFSKASTYYTFKLYSWVSEDESVEYKISDMSSIVLNESITLYAKYVAQNTNNVNMKKGDINRDGNVAAADLNYFRAGILNNATYSAIINAYAYDGDTYKIGDINGDGNVAAADLNYFRAGILNNATYSAKINSIIYVINK